MEILQQHIGGIATCTKKAVCDNCGEEYGAVDTHNHTALKHIAAQEATIRQEGNIEYWYCDDCGRYYKDAQTTQEIQQQETVIAKKNPGHTEESATTDQDGKATTDRSGKEVTQSPGTGDPADPALWLLLLMIAVGVGIGGGVSHKKRFLKK